MFLERCSALTKDRRTKPGWDEQNLGSFPVVVCLDKEHFCFPTPASLASCLALVLPRLPHRCWVSITPVLSRTPHSHPTIGEAQLERNRPTQRCSGREEKRKNHKTRAAAVDFPWAVTSRWFSISVWVSWSQISTKSRRHIVSSQLLMISCRGLVPSTNPYAKWPGGYDNLDGCIGSQIRRW